MSDRYEIRAKIGVGGMGAVYRAYDRQLRREVAIKRLHSQEQKPEETRRTAEFLLREAGVMSKLQHPNIVSVYDCGIDDEGGYVVMELISGETLNETIKRGALPLRDFSSVVDQALEGLIAAQEVGMLHRDIKPTNVMIRWLPSGSFQVKLLDFGLAKISIQPALQTIDHAHSILGSIYFMSPEQFEREPLDPRTDLYSLGCLFYYCLAGRFPFRGATAPDVMVAHLEHDVAPLQPIRPDIPSSICDWVLRLMARRRENRPDDARMAQREYSNLLAALPRKPADAPAGPLPATPPRQGRLIVGVPAPASATSSQRVSTAAVLYPLHRANKRRGWIWPLSAFATFALAAGAYLVLAPNGDSRTGENIPPPGVEDNPFPLPLERPDADLAMELLPFGSPWKFAPPGATLPDAWCEPEFDDTSWASGPAPIGYGDPGLATVIDISAMGANKPMTLSYRTRFDLDRRPPETTCAEIHVVADDGALVFLNGTEIARIGLRAGPLDASTPSARLIETDSEGWLSRVRFPASLLRDGRNTLAVRVHQFSPTSSDSWLNARVGLCKPGTPASPNASLVRAEGFEDILPTSDLVPGKWQFSFKEPPSDWRRSPLPGDLAATAMGHPASATFPGSATRIPWSTENLWMTRTFWIGANDIADPETLALKALHTGNVLVYLNGHLAAERFGSNNHYVVLPIGKHARTSLKQGENRLSVFAAGGTTPQAVDVGIIRTDRRKMPVP